MHSIFQEKTVHTDNLAFLVPSLCIDFIALSDYSIAQSAPPSALATTTTWRCTALLN